jgi:hypothetical protein
MTETLTPPPVYRIIYTIAELCPGVVPHLSGWARWMAAKPTEYTPEAIEAALKHLPGQHDQSTHGRGGGMGTNTVGMDYLEKRSAETWGGLSDSEKASVGDYTDGSYYNMNEMLRGNEKIINSRFAEKTNAKIENLQSAIEKTGGFEDDITVFRGVSMTDTDVSAFSEGGIFSDKGFLSTSANYDDAKFFSENADADRGNRINSVIFVFDVMRGVPCIPFPQGGESEVIFGKGQNFTINKIEKSGNNYKIYAGMSK